MTEVYYRGMLTAKGSMDFDQFTEVMNDLLKRIWGESWGDFIQSEPTGNTPDRIKLPVIAFDTLRRIPSVSHRSVDPILYEKRKDPDHPGTHLEVYRQWFDMETNFFVYHETNREARILMEEFETFLFDYKDHFKELGISDITFKSEEPPQVVTLWGKELPQRQLVYLIRLERIKLKRLHATTLKLNSVVNGQPDQLPSTKATNSLMEHYKEQNQYAD